MIDIKTPEEIAIMREGGLKLGTILQELLDMSLPGVSLLDIENVAKKRIKEAHCVPSFTTVEGYKWATCLCVNEGVVHGIPTERILQNGDVLTVDIGLIHRGFHTDTAWTKIVGVTSDLAKKRFQEVGVSALWKVIALARSGNRVGQLSAEIQNHIEAAGYQIVKSLVGHGVGRELHEDPQIPGFLKVDVNTTPLLTKGVTIAVEIIYAMGSGAVVYDNDDGWTIATKDKSLSAVYEHTIAITDREPFVLTNI